MIAMHLPCRMCHQPVAVPLLKWLSNAPVFCPPNRVRDCVSIYTVLQQEPPEEEEPDPDQIPPEDINECPFCKATGEVIVRRDWQTGAYETAPCRACGGLGEVTPEWLAPESML